jgi:putative FmdB family regulatory protein
MPRYDYKCEAGHVKEVKHGFDDKPAVKCPECGKLMKKALTQSPLIFVYWRRQLDGGKPAIILPSVENKLLGGTHGCKS